MGNTNSSSETIAVVGGGTAGFLAALRIARLFPNRQLHHIYDSRIPRIGVGEGTVATFPKMLHRMTKLTFSQLEERLFATRKGGILYEGWGENRPDFLHHFYPRHSAFGYHLSADYVIEILNECTNATHIDKRVNAMVSSGQDVRIEFEDGTELTVDLAVDARGFPKVLDEKEHMPFDFIPTNTALVRRGLPFVNDASFIANGPDGVPLHATRSVARPHGWMFIIPLQSHTSYGYIYNETLSTQAEVEADFDAFMEADGVTQHSGQRRLAFPNYVSRSIFDGSLFRVGNAAGFMEPLEATALHLTERQNGLLSVVIPKSKAWRKANAAVIDKHLKRWALNLGFFLSWHYACGAAFDTPFWDHARDCWERCQNQMALGEIDGFDFSSSGDQFTQYISYGGQLEPSLPDGSTLRDKTKARGLAGFPAESFTDVGYGIGYYQQTEKQAAVAGG